LRNAKVEPIKNTKLINISYISPDPIEAAKFANILTDVYIRQDVGKRTQTTTEAIELLEKQVDEVKKKLADSEIALNEYAKKNNIVSIPDIEKKTTTILESLKADKVSIDKEIAELSKRYKSKHPKMIAANTRFETVNKGIEEETRKLLDITDKLNQYNILKREIDSNKALYDSLIARTKETGVVKELEATNIRVIDIATVPKEPFSPIPGRDITIGVFLGLFLGLGLAVFLEYLDSTVKCADDLELYVKLPFLGYVPSGKDEVKTKTDIDLIVYKEPQSRVSESFRSIRTSIIFSAPEDRPLKTILITSAAPQEGKSIVAVNLAIIFARVNEKVLLIDADMRRSRLHHILSVDRSVGLSSFLTGAATQEAVIKQTFIPNLFFIASGPIPPNPAELLTSAKVRIFLEEMKTKYDRIIIDSPPVTSVADTSILANMVDGVIDVIRSGFLNIDIILRGRQRLIEAKSRIIGAVLNNVDIKREDTYYYYHYYYAEDKKKKS
jgi:capsular exopolysaccharide synthesis family protein